MRDYREEAIIPDAKLVFIGVRKSGEVMVRIGYRRLKAGHDSSRHGAVESVQIPDGRVRPLDRPGRQRPNRFLTCA
jgi:hypothetical protein